MRTDLLVRDVVLRMADSVCPAQRRSITESLADAVVSRLYADRILMHEDAMEDPAARFINGRQLRVADLSHVWRLDAVTLPEEVDPSAVNALFRCAGQLEGALLGGRD